jgi:hypothetical protein
MQLHSIAIADLIPAPYNPRVTLAPGDPGWERLRRSLYEFDLVQPIVWNRRTRHVVGGHQRLAILKHDGVTAVDCAVVDLPLEREQALNVALNNRHVGGDWDPNKLVSLLGGLQDLPDFDATLTGFDERELNDLLMRPDPDWQPDDDESSPRDFVRVTLEVPPLRWEAIQPRLDELLAAEPALRLHVQRP